MSRAAVLGSPIGHSLSPALHRAAYAALGLDDWSYEAIDVPAGGLAEFIAGLDESWAGLSLTMPLKTEALALPSTMVSASDEIVQLTGSANTVLLSPAPGGGPVRSLANTDVAGIVRAIQRSGGLPAPDADGGLSAAILGAGATARSAVAAVAQLGARRLRVLARRPERASAVVEIAERLGMDARAELLAQASALVEDVVISTLPAGGADDWTGLVSANPGHLLDVVYAPWPTALAERWAAVGGMVTPGLEMLIEQAACQVTLMTGREAPVDQMRAAVSSPS